jgi:hypothetical protein
MDVKYEDLKKGYILKRDDTINFGSLAYRVAGGATFHFLSNCGTESNSRIFELTSRSDKNDWANEFGTVVGGIGNYYFPELDNLKALTKFTIAIYEDLNKNIHKVSKTDKKSDKKVLISLPSKHSTPKYIKL